MVVIIQFFYSFGILFLIVRLSAGNYFEHQPIKIKIKFFFPFGCWTFFKKGIGSQMGSPSVANSIFFPVRIPINELTPLLMVARQRHTFVPSLVFLWLDSLKHESLAELHVVYLSIPVVIVDHQIKGKDRHPGSYFPFLAQMWLCSFHPLLHLANELEGEKKTPPVPKWRMWLVPITTGQCKHNTTV